MIAQVLGDRRRSGLAVIIAAAVQCAACGGSPVMPSSRQSGTLDPPPNGLPVVDSITVQGSRLHEPSNFADAGETIVVVAKVHDDETPADQLYYAWNATAGTFTGTGQSVTWTAPADVPAATSVTISLRVSEKYGANQAFEHSVDAASTLSLHDSMKEVGAISRQFLLDFSDTNIKDADRVMQNFGGTGTCPNPSEVLDERDQVIAHYTFFRMLSFRVDQPIVSVNFGGVCPTVHGPKRGDACASVDVMWDSIDTRDNSRIPNAGTDQITAAYSAANARWFLCSSDYDGHPLTNAGVTALAQR